MAHINISYRYITRKEFALVNDKYNLGYDVDVVFESMDMDQNGAINYNEFVAASLGDKVTKDPTKIKNWYNFFDLNKDGTITIEDFKLLLQSDDISVDNSQFADLIEEMDEDGDGQVSYNEFYRCMSMNTHRKSNAGSHRN